MLFDRMRADAKFSTYLLCRLQIENATKALNLARAKRRAFYMIGISFDFNHVRTIFLRIV
jgi:hypothetical protein